VEYKIPLETQSDVVVTGHGARSITGMEVNLDHNQMTEKQLSAIPGIGDKTAWNLISSRVKAQRKTNHVPPYQSAEDWFTATNITFREEFEPYFVKPYTQ